MKSWSTWKRRRATRTRPSSSCLVPGEVGTGAVGPWWAQLAPKVKMPWAAAGWAAPGGRDGGVAKAQQPPSWGPTHCLSSLSPPRLTAMVSEGTAQIWARFRLCVEARACTACVSVCSLVCLLSAVAAEIAVESQIGPCCGWGRMDGLPKKKKKAPIQRPTCSCLHKTDTLAKAFSLPAPVASTALLPPRPPCTPRSSSCHLESWLASLLLDVCLPGVASLEAGGCGMAEAGGREPGINSSPRTNTVQLSQPPHLLLRLPSKPCLGSREVRQAHGSPLHVFHSENPGLLVGHLFTSHSIRRHAIKTRGRFLGPFELHSVPLFPSTEGLTAQLRGGETPSCAEKLTQGQDSQGYRAGMLLVHQLRALGWQILRAGEKVPEALSPARLYWLNTTEGMILAHSASHFYSHRNDASS